MLEGDTSRPQVWDKLTGLLNETFTSASGLEVPITQLAVDSGYAATEVYQWARIQGHRVVVIKGDSRAAALLGNPAPIEIGPLGAKIKRGVKVWPVNSGMAKEELYRWLRLERPTDEDLQQRAVLPSWVLPLPAIQRGVLQSSCNAPCPLNREARRRSKSFSPSLTQVFRSTRRVTINANFESAPFAPVSFRLNGS